MPRRPVVLAPRAEADLDRIASWIADQGAPLTALDYVTRLRSFITSLDQFPERGVDYSQYRPGLRIIAFERRVVIAVVVRAKRVDVQRVFSGGQHWQRVLRLPED